MTKLTFVKVEMYEFKLQFPVVSYNSDLIRFIRYDMPDFDDILMILYH